MQSYRVREIGDFAEIDHGHAFEEDFFVDDPTGLVVVTPGNFRIGGGFKKDSLKWYSEDGPIPDGYVMSSGDLIVTMTDLSQSADTLGYAAQVPNDEYTYLHNQRIGLVRTGDRISDGYLHYAMRTRQYRQQVVASSSGSTVHHSSPSRILECEIPVPPLPVQHRIADILGALDDKIELNRRMNETLEAMAQALYRHWFVDFGPFQDREFKDTEELGPIPVGWETQKVKEFGKVVLGSTPSTKDEENYGSEYPFIKIPDMHGQVFVDETENYLSEKGAQSTLHDKNERGLISGGKGRASKHDQCR